MGIMIVGLGPGNGRLLTREAWELLSAAHRVYFRTLRHPAVADLPDHVQRSSFDDLYDRAESFEQVYQGIVDQLLTLAAEEDIIYAVPGHPFIAESTVTRLVQLAGEQGIPVRVVAGLSYVELCLTAVKVDGIEGLQLFDAIELIQHHYPPVNPDFPLLLGQVYSRLLASDLKALLSRVYPEEHMVQLIHAAGNEDELVEQVALYEIDRSDEINHLTSLYVPPLPHLSTLAGLADTVAVLRSPDGCPWDQEQTPQSMRAGFLEEACEVLTAVDEEDTEGIREELGDMLYHIVMQAEMAAEEEVFRLTDVIAGIDAKLKRRHPHVWGDVSVADSNEVVVNWEAIKQQEKPQKPALLFDNISPALPALARSQKIQERARKVGFDWPEISGVYEKLAEEIAELQEAQSPEEKTAELGDLLFVAANLAKWLGVDAETALREANLKFVRRFAKVEQLAQERGAEISKLSLAELDKLWEEVKRHEN